MKLWIEEFPGWYWLRKSSAEAQDRLFQGFFVESIQMGIFQIYLQVSTPHET